MTELTHQCHYCEKPATRTLIWLKNRSGEAARIKLLWCGCDLMVAIQKLWATPYEVRLGIDYVFKPLKLKRARAETSFATYVPVGVTQTGRELFRLGMRDAMRKFAAAEKKHGWKDLFLTATEDAIQTAFHEHIEKGDPRDVIIYCLIMLFRGWRIRK